MPPELIRRCEEELKGAGSLIGRTGKGQSSGESNGMPIEATENVGKAGNSGACPRFSPAFRQPTLSLETLGHHAESCPSDHRNVSRGIPSVTLSEDGKVGPADWPMRPLAEAGLSGTTITSIGTSGMRSIVRRPSYRSKRIPLKSVWSEEAGAGLTQACTRIAR